jgi:hypothetical protein
LEIHCTARSFDSKIVSVNDHGFFLTLQAIRRQLAAMPIELYLIRLIHSTTRTVCPGERLWTSSLLTSAATVRFLRGRNREGFDIYILPYAGRLNSGYIFLDLDRPVPNVLTTMRAQGHEPCLVLQSSPGRLQAWIRVSDRPLAPALATTISKHLALLYHADPASTDWCHLGRLAGFTNQKPQRRSVAGHPPWVRVFHSQPGLATHAPSLVAAAEGILPDRLPTSCATSLSLGPPDPALSPGAAAAIYQSWLYRLRIPQRFPQPDWSIADKWIAKDLLRYGTPLSQVHAILLFGSPQFPRSHSDPDDYLRRTLTRALRELNTAPFPAPATLCHSPLGNALPPSFPAQPQRPCVEDGERTPSVALPHTCA